jgi:outer membrane protein assembly factor BamB
MRWRAALLVLSAAAGQACLDVAQDQFVAGIEIIAPDTALLEGHTLQLGVRAWDIERRPVTPRRLSWSSADTSLLTVDAFGLVRAGDGRGGGDVAVWASAGAGQGSDTIVLHVAVHGELRWRLGVGPMSVLGGPAEGPDGTLYVLTNNDPATDLARLYALAPTGSVRWNVPLTQVRSNYPLVGTDGTVYVVGQHVWALRSDGTLRWSLTARPSDIPDSHAGAVDGTGVLYAAMGFDLLAFDGATGDTIWEGPRANDAGWLLPPTVSADGRTAYIKNTGDSIYAFAAGTGTVRWAVADPQPGRIAYAVGAALGGSRLLVPAAERLQELDTLGNEVAVGASYGLGMSEPAVGPDGTLYVQIPQTFGLLAFRRPDLELWRFPGVRSRWPWYGGPALAAGGVLYAAAIDGFYAVDVSPSGSRVRWRFPSDSGDSLVFVGAPLIGRDGTVYSFTSCTNGEETLPCSDEVFAFWEDKPAEPNSPWPMWRHDARRSGQVHR